MADLTNQRYVARRGGASVSYMGNRKKNSIIQTVLIIEDNDEIRKSLESLFLMEEFEVMSATNGKMALSLLGQNRRPSVILLDLMMPEMDGFEFRKHQSVNPDIKDIPTIVFTCADLTPDRIEELGNVTYVQKPIMVDKLISLLQQTIPTT